MKVLSRFRVGFVLAVICSLLVSMVGAEEASVNDLPGTGWLTGIQIQNVGSADATIELTGYDRTSGTAAAPASVQVAPGASANFVNYPAGSSEFDGSGVVSADQPIAAIVNVVNAPAGGYAAGQYQGTDGSKVSTEVSFPLVKNNFGAKCTTFFVQNAGTASATITADFSDGSSVSQDNVAPGQTWLIDPAAANVPGDAPYALTVSSGEPLAGTVLEHPCANAETLQATRGFTADDYSTQLLSPIFKVRFGNRSNGLQVQNVSAGSADITVVFTCSALSNAVCATGTTYTKTASNIAAGASATFFLNQVLGTDTSTSSGDIPDGTLANATVTAVASGTTDAVEIAAINNETFTTIPAGIRQTQTTFSALGVNAASSSVGIPLVKEMFNSQTTGIQIQNASDSDDVTVDVEYNMTAGAAACQGTFNASGISIPAGGSVTLFRPGNAGVTLPGGGTWGGSGPVQEGCFGGATIEVTSANGSVVAIVQEADLDPVAADRLDTKNYEGFPIQ